jgi:low affinity Fe/Cu permease
MPTGKSGFSFTRFAKLTSKATGKPAAFMLAVGVVLAWVITGPIFRYSDTWQLVINTFTTVITFLMVFLIQHTQNRDTEALQVKLDELLRVTKGAHVALLDLEELSDKELDEIQATYIELAEEAREKLRQGGTDTDAPDVRTLPNNHRKG